MSSYSFQGRSRLWIPRDEEENRAIFSAMRQETGITMPDEFKPIYLENEEYEVEKWSPKQLIKLLRLYGSHRCLWDLNDPFHKNRKMRKAAMIDITAAMGQDVTMEVVSQKINVVRSTYRYEKRRIKQRIKKGVGARTKLKWFALADSFLRNVPRADKYKKPDGPTDSDSDLEDTIVFTIDPEILIPLEEDNSGNQNCITIGDAETALPAKNDPEVNEINEQTDEIHQMLENIDKGDFTPKWPPYKWKSNETIRFLKVYRMHKCLWDTNDESHKNRLVKVEALKAIAEEIGNGVSVAKVSRKIIALRAAYRSERRRQGKARDKPQSRLKWYALADSFLRPFCRLKNVSEDPEFLDIDEDGIEEKLNDNNDDENMPDNNDTAFEDNFNDTQSNDSDDEPIARLKVDLYIKSECEDDKDSEMLKKDLLPLVKIPRIRIKPLVRPWMLAESIQFIELFRIHACLWDRKHPNYKKLPERSIAYEDIAHKMDMPERRIRKKMKILLKAYYAERNKIELALEKEESYQTELVWYDMADEFLGRKEEEKMPPPAMAPMSFVDPDLMSPAPSLFQDSNEDKEIKLEYLDSPRDCSPDRFDDAMNSPQQQPSLEIFPPSSSPAHTPVEGFTISPSVEVQKTDLSTDIDDTKPELIKPTQESPIKTEEPADADGDGDEDFPKPEASNEQPTKIIWNGLEDDLLEGKWSLKNSVKFLRLYGAHRCLWDLNCPDYRVKELREAAIEDIAAAMGHGLDAEYVAKKIKIFRITYMQHRKRMLESLKAGKEPEIQLRWFPLADSFLRPHIGLRSIKPGEKEMPQFDFPYVYANLNLIDPALLTDFVGKGTQNSIQLGSGGNGGLQNGMQVDDQSSSEDEEDDDFDDGFFEKEVGEMKYKE